MSASAARTIAHFQARAAFVRARDTLLGPDSGWDPLTTMLEVALGAPLTTASPDGGIAYVVAESTPELRFNAAKEVAGFLYPKLKAVEMTVQGGDEPIRHTIIDDILNLATKSKLGAPDAPAPPPETSKT